MRGRASLSLLLLVLGIVLLAIGTICFYAKRNILDAGRLSNTAVATLDHPEVRAFVAREVADEAIQRVPQLASQRVTIERATDAVVSSEEFKSVLRTAIVVTQQALLQNGVEDTVLKLRGLTDQVRRGVRSFDPRLADKIPSDLNARLASLGRAPLLTDGLQAIHDVDFLGTVLPPLALVLLVASIVLASDRVAATFRLGIGLAVFGIGGFALMLIARPIAIGVVPSGTERSAAGPVWDEVMGPLRVWLVVAGGLGAALAGTVHLWRRNREAGIEPPAGAASSGQDPESS
jgi:hypothetical protein